MPLNNYLYHGHAVGFEADIWEPGPHKVDGHARCSVPDKKPGHYTAKQDPFEIPGVLSHGGCSSEVVAHPEDKDGFFRTEVRSTLHDLKVEGDALTVDRVTLGIVSVYRRHWYDNGKPHAKRVRVVPHGCSIENVRMKGVAVKDYLPSPFHYSVDRCETYLHGDEPDAKVESEIRKAITDTPDRCKYVKGFGRVYFGEWRLLPSEDWHPIHQIYLVRLALGSPQSGGAGGTGGQGDGGGTGT
jgi:hypothetical protein